MPVLLPWGLWEQMALPGSTLITAAALALAAGFVAVKPLGPVPAKGLATPVEVDEVADVRRCQEREAQGYGRLRLSGG